MPTDTEILVKKLMNEYPALDYLMAETIVVTSHKFYDVHSKNAGQSGETDISGLGAAYASEQNECSGSKSTVSAGSA